MPHHVRAVALDYDGTLTSTGRLDETILGALRKGRGLGLTRLFAPSPAPALGPEPCETLPSFARASA